MLDKQFIEQGFKFIHANYYLNHANQPYIHDLKKVFDLRLDQDGSMCRRRAYLKLNWYRATDEIVVARDQQYFQTAVSNVVDGGKVRQFKIIKHDILNNLLMKNILQQNLQLIKECSLFKNEDALTIGLHFIRYQVNENGASYSSPDWLHKDDEPLVFVHLINLTRGAIGGDNLIADSVNKTVTNVVRLENDIDTLVLNKNVYHAVTPLGSKGGVAIRDVILFTVEPNHTQQMMMEGECA